MNSGTKHRSNSTDRCDLDIEWDENNETATAWSAQIKSRSQGRRVYGSSKCCSRPTANITSDASVETPTPGAASRRIKRWQIQQQHRLDDALLPHRDPQIVAKELTASRQLPNVTQPTSLKPASALRSSSDGRAPLARTRVTEKTPQTLLQKLHLSYKRSPPATASDDAIENLNPNLSLFFPTLSSDEATTSSLSKRRKSTNRENTKESIQPHSSSSSPAFSSHSAQSFTYGQIAAASSHKSFARFNSDSAASHDGSLRKHIHFGSDPGGWVSSSNPAINLRALLLQASSVSDIQKDDDKHIFLNRDAATVNRFVLPMFPPNNISSSDMATAATCESERKAPFDHISSSSSSLVSDGEASNRGLTLGSKRMFVCLNHGRNQSCHKDDDAMTSDSSLLDDETCDENDEHSQQSDSQVIAQPLTHAILSSTAANLTPDENLLQLIIETLPSRQIILYLLRQLTAMAKKQKGETSFVASYNNNWMTIVPPNSWTAKEKNELIIWSTKTFGFSLRNASAGVEFMQIKTDKALKVKALLETVLKEKKHRSKLVAGNNNNYSSKGTTKEARHHADLIHVAIVQHYYNERKIVPGQHIATLSKSRAINHMLNKQGREHDVAMMDLPDIGALNIQLDENEHENEHNTKTVNPQQTNQLPRLSVEQSLKSQDIILHMSGHSPDFLHQTSPDGLISTRQRSLMKRPVDCYEHGNMLKFESFAQGRSTLAEMVSPLPSLSNRRSKKLQPRKACTERSNFDGRRDQISPLPQFSAPNKARPRDSRQPLCQNEEQVLTPMLARTSRSYFCCSKYPNTCDWGASMKCDPAVIELLLRRFEEACAAHEDKKVLQQSSNLKQSIPKSIPSAGLLLRHTGSPRVKSSRINEDGEEDYVEDDDSIVPLLGAPKFDWLDNHRNLSLRKRQSLPLEMHKRKRDSIAKLQRQSICKAAKDFSPRRLTVKPTASFFLCVPPINDKSTIEVSQDFTAFSRVDKKVQQLPTAAIDDGTLGLNCPQFADAYLPLIFEYLIEKDLICTATLVCTSWADVATYSWAKIMLISVGCPTDVIPQGKKDEKGASGKLPEEEEFDCDRNGTIFPELQHQNIVKSMEKSWAGMNKIFPWGCFLAEGAYKKVFRVWNATISREEAVSVMDVELIESMGNKAVIGAELAVSVLLSSLARRNICPNFVITRGIFSCRFEPPASHWGCANNKQPLGLKFDSTCGAKKPRQPNAKKSGKFQYIRMELCTHGDLEEFIAKQPEKLLCSGEASHLLFQMAFSLYAASSRYGLKHYDVKLLNFFLQSANNESVDANRHPSTILRYGLGDYIFSLKMPTKRAFIAKLADYGTADLQQDSNGNPVSLGQFTTLENSPPEQLILGDDAVQGFGHDLFGLGLCMLHLFTGEAPYEEILQDVLCPPGFKKKLRQIWLSGKKSSGFSVIKSVILANVFEDEDGNTQGEADETLYHTLYRFIVLFGIPKEMYKMKKNGSVWRAIMSCLGDNNGTPKEKSGNYRVKPTDRDIYVRDLRLFSFCRGSDHRISRARRNLKKIAGGVELLLSLVEFNPEKRSTALDVLNSEFMSPLRCKQVDATETDDSFILYSFMAFRTPSGKKFSD